MAKPIMTIVGFGTMGKRFARLFSRDFNVRISSSRDIMRKAEEVGVTVVNDRHSAIAESDYVFLAVPLTALTEMTEEVNAYARPNAVVIDCCSARIPAEQSLGHLKCQHFGMHDVKSGEYCITGEIDDIMESFFERHNIGINCISAEKHDQLNAVVGLGHFIGLALGQFFSDEQKDILSGIGSGSKLMSLVNSLAGNSPTTWRETQIDNQYSKEMRLLFLDALNQYHKALSEGIYPFEQNSEQGTAPDADNRPR